jgi:phospholipid/cholesterol/gamma-HCH transport system substrate-binding protein
MRRRNEVAVGILVTVAGIMLIGAAIWGSRGGFGSGYPLYTKFAWGQNLKDGQAVRLAGVAVGYVDEVILRSGYLDVKLAITEKKFRIPKGSTAIVQPVGIFGDVEVALTPPMPLPTDSYEPGDTVPAGTPPTSMSQVLGRVDSIGQSVERLTRALDAEFVAAGGIRDMRRTMAGLAAFTAQLQGFSVQLQGMIARQDANMTATMRSFEESARKVGTMIDSAAIDSTLRNVRTSSANLVRLSQSLDSAGTQFKSLMAALERGEGTAGKLLKDPTIALRLEGLLMQVDSLVLDLKRNPSKYISIRIF